MGANAPEETPNTTTTPPRIRRGAPRTAHTNIDGDIS